MAKGFDQQKFNTSDSNVKTKNKKLGNERMISWSPWPPANFQSKYPAFPLVMTIILLFILQMYISLVK
tara:strand:- start:3099 stop:3302 length:204 start_codon:yes stop_codon:yes gene_type:complete